MSEELARRVEKPAACVRLAFWRLVAFLATAGDGRSQEYLKGILDEVELEWSLIR